MGSYSAIKTVTRSDKMGPIAHLQVLMHNSFRFLNYAHGVTLELKPKDK